MNKRIRKKKDKQSMVRFAKRLIESGALIPLDDAIKLKKAKENGYKNVNDLMKIKQTGFYVFRKEKTSNFSQS